LRQDISFVQFKRLAKTLLPSDAIYKRAVAVARCLYMHICTSVRLSVRNRCLSSLLKALIRNRRRIVAWRISFFWY